MTDKVYFRLGGGFGDTIRWYFRGEGYWNYLKPLKEKYPNIKTKVISCCHNSQVLDMIEYNPYLDFIENYGWTPDGRYEKYKKDYTWIQKTPELLRDLEPSRPKLYLAAEDHKIVDPILSAGPYVTIHPFAGLPDRIVFPVNQYPRLIDELIDQHGYNVVVLGSDHARINEKTLQHYPETFMYQRKGLFNLVNQTNGRVSVQLVRKCARFIGTWSCYVCAAWVSNKHSVMIAKPRHRKRLREVFSTHWTKRGDCREIYIEDKQDWDHIRTKIIEETL